MIWASVNFWGVYKRELFGKIIKRELIRKTEKGNEW